MAGARQPTHTRARRKGEAVLCHHKLGSHFTLPREWYRALELMFCGNHVSFWIGSGMSARMCIRFETVSESQSSELALPHLCLSCADRRPEKPTVALTPSLGVMASWHHPRKVAGGAFLPFSRGPIRGPTWIDGSAGLSITPPPARWKWRTLKKKRRPKDGGGSLETLVNFFVNWY